jgi:hypothetical protein
MIRTLNFMLIVVTGLMCLGLYRIAEEARVAAADLKATRVAIAREKDALTVLGAEWARVTQPGRIQALAQRHLNLTDKPAVELSSLRQLPAKNPPLAPESDFRNANVVVPQSAPQAPTASAKAQPPQLDAPTLASLHTGT